MGIAGRNASTVVLRDARRARAVERARGLLRRGG
jgi:hypothetical protein